MNRVIVIVAAAIAVLWAGPGLAQPPEEGTPKEETKDLRREVESLRREIQELRLWKTQVEDKAPAGAQEKPAAPKMRRDVHEMLEPAKTSIVLPRSLKLSVSGELRPRAEVKRNLYSPADPQGAERFDFTHMRSRLRFDLEVDNDVDAVFELQDVRVFGDEGSTIADTEGVDLKRGAMVLSNLLDQPVSLEVGRFVLAYGDHRLIGDLEWFDQGRSYDGFRISFDPQGYFADVFGTRIRDDAAGVAPAQDLLGVYAGIQDLLPALTAEGYALLFRDQQRSPGEEGMGNTQFLTLGTRLDGKSEGFDYTGEIALQRGEVRDDDLSAWALALRGGYTFEETNWEPRLGFEVDYATGNQSPDDGDNETFQTLFPTNHRHYGYADLLGWSNMFTVKAGVTVAPAPDVSVSLDAFNFRLDDPDGGWINAGGQTVRPGVPGASRDLGQEIDLALRWKASRSLAILAGWSHFFPGDFVEETGDDPDADFLYLQAHLRF